MPSYRVSGSIVTLSLYDVVGQDGEPNFIEHVGLAAKDGQQNSGAIEVVHMGPPLQKDGQMKPHARGTVNLDFGEIKKIENFIDRHDGEHAATKKLRGIALLLHAADIYCIHPHATPHRERDGRYVRTRFSCTGFVFEAYNYAGIELVDDSEMPPIDLKRLKQMYPKFARRLDDHTFRESMGLSASGDWRLMLCGYLLHALNRDAAIIRSTPYVPSGTDAYFH